MWEPHMLVPECRPLGRCQRSDFMCNAWTLEETAALADG